MSRPRAAAGVLGAVAIVIGLLAGGWIGWTRSAEPPRVDAWKARVHEVAAGLSLDPHLLLALVAAESGGDERAISQAGARGLLQLMLPTAKEQARLLELPEPDAAALLEGDLNLRLGAAYLRRLLDRFDGELVFALAAYNAGPTAVRRWSRRALDAPAMVVLDREAYPETRAHVRRVLRYRDAFAAGTH